MEIIAVYLLLFSLIYVKSSFEVYINIFISFNLNKSLTVKEKYNDIDKVKDEFNLDPAMTLIIASKLGYFPYDYHFDAIYGKELNAYDYSIIERKIGLDELLPKGSQHINVTVWKDMLAHVVYNLPKPVFDRVITKNIKQ